MENDRVSSTKLFAVVEKPLELTPIGGEYRIEDVDANEQYAIASLSGSSARIRFYSEGTADGLKHGMLYQLEEIDSIYEGKIGYVQVKTIDGSVFTHRKNDRGEIIGFNRDEVSYTRPSADNIRAVMLHTFTNKAPEFFYTDVINGRVMCDLAILGEDKVMAIGDKSHYVGTSLLLELNHSEVQTIVQRNGETKRVQFNPTRGAVEDVITRWASQNQRNMFLESIRRIQWDGVDRVGTLLRDVGGICPYPGKGSESYLSDCMWAFLLGTIQRHVEDRYSAIPVVLVLMGGQGCGKSQFCQKLGVVAGENFYGSTSESVANTRRFLESTQGSVILELTEATQFGSATAEQMKAIVDTTSLSFRDAYARDSTAHKIYYSMIATTNDMTLLSDGSGNRRFFPVVLRSDDAIIPAWDLEEYYIDQVWAQAYQAYRDGARYGDYVYEVGSKKKLRADIQRAQGSVSDPDDMFDAIQTYLAERYPNLGDKMKTHELEEYLLDTYPINADQAKKAVKMFRKHPESFGFGDGRRTTYYAGYNVRKPTYVYTRLSPPLLIDDCLESECEDGLAEA